VTAAFSNLQEAWILTYAGQRLATAPDRCLVIEDSRPRWLNSRESQRDDR
jgi:hypothetical protein